MDWELFIPGALLALIGVAAVLIASARKYPRTRPWVTVAVVSVAAMPLGILLHNVVSAILGGEEAIFFITALVLAPVGFALGTIGCGIILVRGPASSVGASLLIAGAGMAVFGLYAVIAVVATSLAGHNLEWQRTVEPLVLPASLLALVAGALLGLLSVRSPRRDLGLTP